MQLLGTTNAFTKAMASAGQKAVDDAITTLNGYRGDIGSTQNQVESAIRNLMTQSTNIKAAGLWLEMLIMQLKVQTLIS